MEKEFDNSSIIAAWTNILSSLGLDINDPNFKDTPQRIMRSYHELFAGLEKGDDIEKILSVTFPSEYSGIIACKGVHCWSMCPHHFLPVEYYVDIGYVSNNKVLGISKLGRIVKLIAKKPMLQEDYTKSLTDIMTKYLDPKGSIILVKGRHTCMTARGLEQEDCWTYTSSIAGVFNEHATREEFMMLLGR